MYVIKQIFSSFEEAETAALKKCSKSFPIVKALYGVYPNLKEVSIEYITSITIDEPETATLKESEGSQR